MRVPQFARYKRFVQAASVFFLGVVAGAILFNGLYHFQLDAVHHTIDELNSLIEERDHDIKQLGEFKNQHTVIKTIRTYIERSGSAGGVSSSGLDTRTEAELK